MASRTAAATSTRDFFTLLLHPTVLVIQLRSDLQLDPKDVPTTAVVIRRNLSIEGAPSGTGANQSGAVPISELLLSAAASNGTSFLQLTKLDFAFLYGKIQLVPGAVLTLRSLELFRSYSGTGSRLTFMARSPGAQVELVGVIQRRLACMPPAMGVVDFRRLPRPRPTIAPGRNQSSSPGAEQVFGELSSPPLCWSTRPPAKAGPMPNAAAAKAGNGTGGAVTANRTLCRSPYLDIHDVAFMTQMLDFKMDNNGGYVVRYLNSAMACDYYTDDRCVAELGVDRCVADLLAAHANDEDDDSDEEGGRPATAEEGVDGGVGEGAGRWQQLLPAGSGTDGGSGVQQPPPPPPPPPQQQQVEMTATSSGESDGAGPRRRVALGASLGSVGLFLLLLLLGLALYALTSSSCAAGPFVVTRRLERRLLSSSPVPAPGKEMAMALLAAVVAVTAAVVVAMPMAVRWQLACSGRQSAAVRILEPIGRGAFGRVYRGVWQGIAVAVKVLMLPASLSPDERHHHMAVMEAAVSSMAQHPRVVQTYCYNFNAVLDSAVGRGDMYCDLGTLREALDKGAFHPRTPRHVPYSSGCTAVSAPAPAPAAPGGDAALELDEAMESLIVTRPVDGDTTMSCRLTCKAPRSATFAQLQRTAPPAAAVSSTTTAPSTAAVAATLSSAAAAADAEEEEGAGTAAAASSSSPAGFTLSRGNAGDGGGGGGEVDVVLPREASQRTSPPESVALVAGTAPTAEAAEAQRHGLAVITCLTSSATAGCWRNPHAPATPPAATADVSARTSTPSYRYDLMLAMACDVASAMLHLHSNGIVHGDLKASNVMLSSGICHRLESLHTPSYTQAADAASGAGAGRTAATLYGNDSLFGFDSSISEAGSLWLAAARLPSLEENLAPPRTGTRYGSAAAAAGGSGGGAGGYGGGGGGGSSVHGSNPSSVLAAELPPGVVAKVGDFGLATHVDESAHGTHVSASAAQGTLTHTAPELLLHGHISKSCDTYAYGILLYELFTGDRPYKGINRALLPHQVAFQGLRPVLPPHTPPDYRSLAESCWQADPRKRGRRYAGIENGEGRKWSGVWRVGTGTAKTRGVGREETGTLHAHRRNPVSHISIRQPGLFHPYA
ncbi:hypothetical protein VOLCADRAFT_92279 [Volvox carteri f. nagariensis]|uniref:Protein kinase domain-containing protein n=1 Tax=Volvox carteri f. nagariensis TaxID=3068 RepID=D8TZ86_VOLCA|nr:uncharacterized protein VOLCADRAFT_92279 [Volvox carteri f. nagariensis]EFJ47232.1 hypothetical protein VOLCADRAFT_92279 [Volvox carteri f. nagariensis]|eukprot:XP_002951781.1 hypothetical protein VOLCADRAFT_92279 [Volvox carteri f. nagariensis]